jgi:hypothetical protein
VEFRRLSAGKTLRLIVSRLSSATTLPVRLATTPARQNSGWLCSLRFGLAQTTYRMIVDPFDIVALAPGLV